MGIKTVNCYTLICDKCTKNVASEYDDGIPHFASEVEALAALRGDPGEDNESSSAWLDGQQLPDGSIWCGGCNAERMCGDRGHLWSEWKRCRCHIDIWGPIPSHVDGCPEYRYCERDSVREERAATGPAA